MTYPNAAHRPPSELHLAESSPELLGRLTTALRAHGIDAYEEELVRMGRRALHFHTDPPIDSTALGATRFGGAPDLPPGVEYPTTDGKLWLFIAQLSLKELAPLQSYLPRQGHLLFFVEEAVYARRNKVMFWPGPTDRLERYEFPDSVTAGRGFVDEAQVQPLRGVGAVAELAMSIPMPNTAGYAPGTAQHRLSARVLSDEYDGEGFIDIQSDLGWKNADCHSVNSYVYTQHECPEWQAAKSNRGRQEEWVNLLSVGWDNHARICFLDGGALTFTVHENDLVNEDFDHVFTSLESS
ncbi:MAG: DUF1963 domain-containing protein [Myxococcota bacterium]